MTRVASSAWPARPAVRVLVLAWLWLGLLGLFGRVLLTQLAPWMLPCILAVLAGLPAYGLFVQGMTRKRLLKAQFAEGGWVGRWLSGAWFQAFKAVLIACVLTVVALFQAWFLAPWEWAGLAWVAPVFCMFAWRLFARLHGEFSSPVFAWRWAHMGARWLSVLLLGGLWLGAMVQGGALDLSPRQVDPSMSAEALDAAIAQIRSAPSGMVRWGLDALLALQVANSAMQDVPQAAALRLLLLALLGPLGLMLCVAGSVQGALALVVAETAPSAWRQPTAPVLSAQKRAGRAAWLAFVCVLCVAIALQGFAGLDGSLRQQDSPLALQRLEPCERIGKQLYRIGAADAARAQALAVLRAVDNGKALCGRVGAAREQADQAIEKYLDWYFSLGAEWGRIASLLTGDVDAFLQQRLQQTLEEAPGLDGLAQSIHALGQHNADLIARGEQRVQDVLERHHLAVDANRCLVQLDVPELPALDLMGQARERAGLSMAAGGTAGAFAALVAGKAMAKVSMKAAVKVLAKAAAKQGVGRVGAAAAGAAVGSILPGVGTLAGAAVGAAVGLATSVAIDWAALRAEEALTRESMRADLRAVLEEQFAAFDRALVCNGSR